MGLKNSINAEMAIDKGVDYLISNQDKDGSISLNKDARWKVWETANAIITINSANKNKKSFLEKSVNFLSNIQREDGSFYHTISSKKDEYCMETTPVCILALSAAKKDVRKGIEFMLDKQNPDGSWEIGTPEIIKRRFWPSIAGFVISTLLHLKISSNQISKGIDFLIEKQQEDGSWGSNWVYYDTPYYPMHAILLAFELYGLNKSMNYKKAVNYIFEKQNNDGSWYIETTDKPRPSRALRTTLALNSLLVSPDNSHLESVEKGVKWLLGEQKSDGHWDGGYFVNWPGKKEDIYTTSMAIRALNKYRAL